MQKKTSITCCIGSPPAPPHISYDVDLQFGKLWEHIPT